MIDVNIRFSHNIAGDDFYNVYVSERHVGRLTNQLSSGYRFEPDKKAPIANYHTFNSLYDALQELPSLVIDWLALAALKTMGN